MQLHEVLSFAKPLECAKQLLVLHGNTNTLARPLPARQPACSASCLVKPF